MERLMKRLVFYRVMRERLKVVWYRCHVYVAHRRGISNLKGCSEEAEDIICVLIPRQTQLKD
ncbi:hypothetical protein NDU88_004229, partial [Pleurodeles waltl]